MHLHRSWSLTLLQAAVTVCVAGAPTRTSSLRALEQLSVDWRFVARGVRMPQERIVIVELDKEAFDKLKDPFIFWGRYFARIVTTLHAFKARAIGLDVLQPESLTECVPPDNDADQLFAQALAQAPETVLICAFDDLPDGTVERRDPTDQLSIALALAGGLLGYDHMTPDDDQVIRRHQLADGTSKERQWSFPLALAVVATSEQPQFRSSPPRIELGQRIVPTDAR